MILLSIFSSCCSKSNIFSKFSHLAVKETNEVRNCLSIRISIESSLLVIISSLIAFSSAVISLCGFVFSSLIGIILGSLGSGNSVIEWGDSSFKIGNITVVLVNILLEESNIFVIGTYSIVFSFSFKIESLVHLVLEVINELNNLSGEFLICNNLLVSACKLSEHLDSLTIVNSIDEVWKFSGWSTEDLFNLSHN